jgi:hypothetical protein
MTRPCAPFSPARVDNSVQHTLAYAQSQPPRSVQGAVQGDRRQRDQPLAKRWSRWPWLADERCPRDTWPRRQQWPSQHGIDTALTRQSRSVARAIGPRHRRSRLRHRTCRRGAASAASRPSLCTSGQNCVPVYAAGSGPVSTATLKRTLRGWTVPAACWAARGCSGPLSARQGARTDAAPCRTSLPPRGTAVSTGAAVLCPCR